MLDFLRNWCCCAGQSKEMAAKATESAHSLCVDTTLKWDQRWWTAVQDIISHLSVMQLKNSHWGYKSPPGFWETLANACINNLSPRSRSSTCCVRSPVCARSQKIERFQTFPDSGEYLLQQQVFPVSKSMKHISPRLRNSLCPSTCNTLMQSRCGTHSNSTCFSIIRAQK